LFGQFQKNEQKFLMAKKSGPKKPPTPTDLALRRFIQDLIDRKQIGAADWLGIELGYREGNVIRFFMKENRNFPKGRIPRALELFTSKYKANKEFLLTNKGPMYRGAPYMASPEELRLRGPQNVLGIGAVKKLQELEIINEQLEKKNQELQQIIQDKIELINTQRALIQQLESGPKLGRKVKNKQV
jgi:hypothetical protein